MEKRKGNKVLLWLVNCLRRIHLDFIPFVVYIYIWERIRPSEQMIEQKKFFTKNKDKVKKIISFLSDDCSKKTYKTLISYRMSRKRYPLFVMEKPSEQYFPTVFRLKSECFVDCGAFIGDTIENFAHRDKNFEAIYAFEPDRNNFAMLQRNVEKFDRGRISLYELGTSDKSGQVRFVNVSSELNNKGNACAMISEEGDITINIDSLDNVLMNKKVTFIKMDVEGAEMDSLKGCKNIIVSQRPILAISIYHSPADMVEIPLLLYSMCKDYRFYVRHYTIDMTETVFYAVPKERGITS